MEETRTKPVGSAAVPSKALPSKALPPPARLGGSAPPTRRYPWLLAILCLGIAALAGGDLWLLHRQDDYGREVERLRHGMSTVERRRADYVVAANKDHFRLMVELIRRQAEGDRELHLSVAVDRAEMSLEREGVPLRVMPIRVGPDAVVGRGRGAVPVAAPRGQRTVASIGPWSITLDGGTQIYADSGHDVLSDGAGVTPGNVRVQATDLQAIMPDVKPGMSVYFY